MIERVTYTTQPSAQSMGRYITVYAPDGSYVSRHINMEECTESALAHAQANEISGTYRFVPPEKHMSVQILRTIPGIDVRGYIAEPQTGIITAEGYLGASFDNNNPGVGDNQTRVDAVLNGRTIPFSMNYPADPVTTREATVSSASEFNTQAAIAGTLITVSAPFSGNINISANDVDVVIDNAYTITGDLNLLGSPSRIRWTGGNLAGQINITAGNDVLFDDFYLTTTFPDFNYIGAGGNDRVAFINSTLEKTGGGSGDTWIWFVLNAAEANRHTDWFVGNVLFTGDSTPSLVRFQSMLRLAMVDVVSNPDSVSAHACRFHDGCEDVWVKDTWLKGILKIDNIGSPTNPSLPNIANAVFDNVDVYNQGASTFNSYVDDIPSSPSNSGSVSGSTYYSEDGAGSFPTPTGFSNGGGNSQVAWDGATLPDYSAVGAIR